jgi:hypothetical protein
LRILHNLLPHDSKKQACFAVILSLLPVDGGNVPEPIDAIDVATSNIASLSLVLLRRPYKPNVPASLANAPLA